MATNWIEYGPENAKFTVRIGSWDHRYRTIWAKAKEKTITDIRRNALKYLKAQKNPQARAISIYKNMALVGSVGIDQEGRGVWITPKGGYTKHILNKDGTLGRRY